MDWQPKIIFWETTRKCNLSCAYCRMPNKKIDRKERQSQKIDCFAPSGLAMTASHKFQDLELNTTKVFEVLNDIKDAFGSPIIIFSGGEPLLRNDIFDIIGHASGIGLPAALATNGTLLGEKEARSLKKLGIKRVSLSIDSADEFTHDISRGVKGAFGKTIIAASILSKFEIPFQINFTVTPKNAAEIRSIAEFAVSLGASAVHYFVLVPVGCGREQRSGEMLDPAGTERALEAIRSVSRELNIEVRPTCAPQYIGIAPDSKGGGCLAGTGAFFISAEGDIYPCGYLPVKAGSLHESLVGSIWRDSETFRRLRLNDLEESSRLAPSRKITALARTVKDRCGSRLAPAGKTEALARTVSDSGNCAKCDLKDACRGCRARAYSATGNFMSGDPSCKHKSIRQREKGQYYSSSEDKIMGFSIKIGTDPTRI